MTMLKRRGRPKKLPEAGKRVHLGLRTTVQLKSKLAEAARVNGRSISQDAELRLERSFERADLLPDILDLVYGREAAGMLLAMAAVMVAVGREAAFQKGGRLGAASWLDDPYAFDQAARAIQIFLDKARPAGELVEPNFDWIGSAFETVGEVVGDMKQYEFDRPSMHVRALIKTITSESSIETYREDAARIRSLNCKITSRLVSRSYKERNNGDRS